MENYIVINGKKRELTEEQLKALGIETKEEFKSPYDRVESGKVYYLINSFGIAESITEPYRPFDNKRFEAKNYYNNKQFAEQKALRAKLTNMLEDFSYKNGWKDEYRYDEEFQKYYFRFDYKDEVFVTKVYIFGFL